MKKVIQIPVKGILAFASVLMLNMAAYAATFTAVASGDWSSSTTWGGTVPSTNNTADQIVIPSGISVNLDQDVTINGSTASLQILGGITGSASRTLAVTNGTVSGTGSIDIGVLTLDTDATMSFTGTILVNTLTTAMPTFSSVANTTVTGNLNLNAGVYTVHSTGSLTMGTGSIIVVNGGTLVNNGGTLGLGNGYNVVYSGGDAIAGVELAGSGLQNITINPGSGKSVTLSNALHTYGILTLESGTLILNGNHLIIDGDIAASGNGTISSGAGSNVTVTTAGGTTGTLVFHSSNNIVNNFTLDAGNNNTVKLGGALNINGDLNLTSGTLQLSTSNLVINGNVTGGGTGNISSTSTSNITINSSSTHTGNLNFAAGANTVNNLTMNLGNNGMANLGTDLKVAGTLNMLGGHLNIGNNILTINNGGMIANANSTSHIVADVNGKVAIAMQPGTTAVFPLGTTALYFPATIQLNSNTTARTMSVGIDQKVYANGNLGADISATRPVVKNTWNIMSDIGSSLNMNLQLAWEAAAEVNGFMRNSSRIAHYTNGSWDATATTPAAVLSGGLYSQSRTNITSLSPFAVMDANTTASVKDAAAAHGFEVYPNPAKDQVSVSSATSAPVNVDLLDLSGKMVKNFSRVIPGTALSLQNIAAGTYFLRVYNSEQSHTVVFIKQ